MQSIIIIKILLLLFGKLNVRVKEEKCPLLVSPCLSPGAGVAAAAAAAAVVVLGVISQVLVSIVTGTGLETQAPSWHPGRLVHRSYLVLFLKL